MQITRALSVVAIVAMAVGSTDAAAQEWPSRLVRIVVPAAAGGSSDAAARLVTNHFQTVFRQPFIIENKPGNGNALGAAFVAQAEPDGYTPLSSKPDGSTDRQECRLRPRRRLQPHRHADELALCARGLPGPRCEDPGGVCRQGARAAFVLHRGQSRRPRQYGRRIFPAPCRHFHAACALSRRFYVRNNLNISTSRGVGVPIVS
jgi:Tripartite tricarboxylate transporter family receptor